MFDQRISITLGVIAVALALVKWKSEASAEKSWR